ncbi:MAG: L-aspartate oxidase [Candidatus Gastranaerophilaceae bacterium]|jgi:L-aspartate oxidase
MQKADYSVIIIGSGIAGLYAALKIAETRDLKNKILLVTKSRLGESNSRYAQGGIVGVLPENKKDSVNLHIEDTLNAGADLSSYEVAKFISEHSAEAIYDLIKKGVDFDRDESQNLSLTIEGAHSINRILHAGGDSTGKHIELALVKLVEENPQIDICCQTQAVELLVDEEGDCRGTIIFDVQNNTYKAVFASSVVIATGGMGQIYSNTTNPSVATADGMALAYRVNAVLQDMEFIQFHPTALFLEENGTRFLISESVRGEGARLKNVKGELFTYKYDERGDLAPRDIVTRSIWSEMQETGADFVYLDTPKINKELLLSRFPNITKVCKEKGIDITAEPIPVSPAAHYSMGGIKITVNGKTAIKGLYATGEAGCTSLHGANRLASNSLLECAVSSNELAKIIDVTILTKDFSGDKNIQESILAYEVKIEAFENNLEDLIKELKDTMWQNAGIIRSEASLNKALNDINSLKHRFDRENKCSTLREYEFRNMLTIAETVVKSALNRRESRGAHFRSDYKKTLDFAYHSFIEKGELLRPNEVPFK